MGLALHNYIQSNETLPPSGSWVGSTTPPLSYLPYPGNIYPGNTGNFAFVQTTSMKVRLLPFMEQQQVYNAYNFWFADTLLNGGSPNNLFPYSVVNLTVTGTKINSFICPSDAFPGNNQSIAMGFYTFTIAPANYAENLGIEPVTTGGRLNGPAWYLGGLANNTAGGATNITDPNLGNRISLANVTDGTSNTVIFSEWMKGSGALTPLAAKPGLNAVFVGGRMTGGASQFSQIDVLNCQSVQRITTNIVYDLKGTPWTNQDSGRGGGYWHIMPPNKTACAGNGSTTWNQGQVGTMIGPSSFHSGGVNMLFLDGTVRFVKDTIGALPYYGMATIAGAEVVSADQL
jgi:prepilin-type processing-associated H-X9-DG protein